jgi:hypothetical protein
VMCVIRKVRAIENPPEPHRICPFGYEVVLGLV